MSTTWMNPPDASTRCAISSYSCGMGEIIDREGTRSAPRPLLGKAIDGHSEAAPPIRRVGPLPVLDHTVDRPPECLGVQSALAQRGCEVGVGGSAEVDDHAEPFDSREPRESLRLRSPHSGCGVRELPPPQAITPCA